MAEKKTVNKDEQKTSNPGNQLMTLSEWCADCSRRRGRSIEVLSGFEFSEKTSLKKLPRSVWDERFQKFLKQPV